jgi:hypothetical protein
MSIYATVWALRFPHLGEYHPTCEWVTVLAQAVPAHVGGDGADPYASFLPPISDSIADDLRAVVFVAEETEKGTDRSGQEYLAPLLVLSGKEYASMPFPLLHAKLCDALRGDRPRLAAELVQPDGTRRLFFEDGSFTQIPFQRKNGG